MTPRKRVPPLAKSGGRKPVKDWVLYRYLIDTMKSRRLEAGVLKKDVAASANVSAASLGRHENYYDGSDDLDGLVAAYAEQIGCYPVDLWLGAISRWVAEEHHPTSRRHAARMREAFRRAEEGS